MHNAFIHRLDPWKKTDTPSIRFLNRALRRAGMRYRVRKGIDDRHEMSTVEHRVNLFHLADQVCAYQIPGDFIELGCYIGETACVLSKVLSDYDQADRLVLFDSFEKGFGLDGDLQEALIATFRHNDLPKPRIVKGRFDETLPSELGDAIAFCHIDCGGGMPIEVHAQLVEHCLRNVYPRMVSGAMIVLMDYWDGQHPMAYNVNPGVRLGTDRFLADKPERVSSLYAGDGAQAYIRRMG